ncbi:hypothetical protein [Zavarzinella formosa]|uniref:hypothetical protein n=1 Tax=Zavarzinella formosa TaxID=360055 RepID=UPI0003009145|nr:hypothetical protein [Zavarzinella formosa]
MTRTKQIGGRSAESVAFFQLTHAVKTLFDMDVNGLCKADVVDYDGNLVAASIMLGEYSKAFRDLAFRVERHERAMRTDI